MNCKPFGHGIPMEHTLRPIRQRHFEIQDILMWTIHDFLGYCECSNIVSDPYIYTYLKPIVM